VNEWEIAALVLGVALIPCLCVCFFGAAEDALPAFEVAGTICSTALILLSEGFHRQPFIDLAIVLAVLSLIGSVAFARMMEAEL
jgi:multisubunit Na+/H+ antiporter MnhF subunit